VVFADDESAHILKVAEQFKADGLIYSNLNFSELALLEPSRSVLDYFSSGLLYNSVELSDSGWCLRGKAVQYNLLSFA
jgi:hypothetical protein